MEPGDQPLSSTLARVTITLLAAIDGLAVLTGSALVDKTRTTADPMAPTRPRAHLAVVLSDSVCRSHDLLRELVVVGQEIAGEVRPGGSEALVERVG